MDLSDIALAQASVIGSMLIDERCIGPVLGMVAPEDFVLPEYRQVYLAIRKHFSAGEPVDIVTVLGTLSATPTADWTKLLQQCMEVTPTTANVDAHVAIMRRQARLAQMRDLGELLSQTTTQEAAQDYIARLNALMVDRPGVRIVTMEQGVQEFLERQTTKATYLPWGFGELDRRLYVGAGKFVILGGYASHGKTAFALSAAWAMAQDHRVGVFSLETDDGTLMERIVSHVAPMSMGKIKRRDLSDDDFAAIASVSDYIAKRKLEIVVASGMTVSDIMATAQRRRYDVIYIDYVQLIRGDKRRGRTEEVTGISIDLHTMAQTTGITIVGLSQLSRPEKATKGQPQKAPRMSDLRESGQLEQDADVVMMLYREVPDDASSRRILSIEKNKEGELGKVYLDFDGDTQTFRRIANRTPPPEPKRKEARHDQVSFTELPDSTKVPF